MKMDKTKGDYVIIWMFIIGLILISIGIVSSQNLHMFAGKGDVKLNKKEMTTNRRAYIVDVDILYETISTRHKESKAMVIVLNDDEQLEAALDMIAGSHGSVEKYVIHDQIDDILISDAAIEDDAKRLCLQGFNQIRKIKY